MISQCLLNEEIYPPHNIKGVEHMRSSLTIGDVVDAVSSWGKIRLIQKRSECSWIHRIYIEFHKKIDYGIDNQVGLRVSPLEPGKIHNTPFYVYSIDDKKCMGRNSMCIFLFCGDAFNISPAIYHRFIEYNPELGSYYYQTDPNDEYSYYKLIDSKIPSEVNINDVRRLILIAWIKYSGDEILKNGLYFDMCYTQRDFEYTKESLKQHYETSWSTLYEM